MCPRDERIACYVYQWNAFRVYNIADGRVTKVLHLSERINNFQFSPDGQSLICVPSRIQENSVGELGLWVYDIETKQKRFLKNWLNQFRFRRQNVLNVDIIDISSRPRHKMTTVFVRGLKMNPSDSTHQTMLSTHHICLVDTDRDQLIGSTVSEYYINDRSLLKDSSVVYDSSYWDEKAQRNVTRLTWTDFKQKKHLFTFQGSLFSGTDDYVGYSCARNAMKVVVYGILMPNEQAERRKWADSLAFIWTVNPQSCTKSLVLRETVRLKKFEKWVIPSSVDLSPDGRQLAYISYRNAHNVNFKQIE
jgi:hypothetical protein